MALEAQLRALDLEGLVRRVQSDPEIEYVFKHALVQETAYASLLKAARAELHLRVAETMEAIETADATEADAAVLAMHYARAGLHERAFGCSIRAGDSARRVYATREALAHYAAALEATRHMTHIDAGMRQAVHELYVNRGGLFEVLGDNAAAIANYEAMARFAEAIGDPRVQADSLNHLNTVRIVTLGARGLQEGELNHALDLARASGDPLVIGRALLNLGLFHRFSDPGAAAELCRQAHDVASAGGHDKRLRDLAANALLDSCIAMVVSGRMRESEAFGRRAVDAYRALDNRHMLADALGGTALALYYQGQVQETLALAGEGVRTSSDIDNPWGILYNEWRLIEVELDRGNYGPAIARLTDRAAMARRLGFPVFTGTVLAQAARAHLERGELEAAWPLYDEGAAQFASMHMPLWSLWAHALRALPRLRAGQIDAAGELLLPLWGTGDEPTPSFQGYIEVGPVIAEWALAAGQIEHGLRFSDWMLERLEAEGSFRVAGEMRLWRARLRLAQGDRSGAQADVLAARDWLAHSEAHVLLAQANALAGDLANARP